MLLLNQYYHLLLTNKIYLWSEIETHVLEQTELRLLLMVITRGKYFHVVLRKGNRQSRIYCLWLLFVSNCQKWNQKQNENFFSIKKQWRIILLWIFIALTQRSDWNLKCPKIQNLLSTGMMPQGKTTHLTSGDGSLSKPGCIKDLCRRERGHESNAFRHNTYVPFLRNWKHSKTWKKQSCPI